MLMIALLAPLAAPRAAAAQDDSDEIPLGDVARNLRKKTPPAKPVIDDDNLPQVMQEADHHDLGQGLRFLMSGKRSGFQVEAPDVTCSLSFSANVKSLLSGQYAEMELPSGEMAKVEGKAVVEGDALTVPVFNGTQWHLSEISVAFTVVKKGKAGGADADPAASSADPVHAMPVLEVDAFQQVRPEKKPDVTVIYRMRAAALPWSNAVFSAPMNMELAAGEEWHWAIVQARGYPPEKYVSKGNPTLTQPPEGESVPSPVSMKSTAPENDVPVASQPPQ